MHSDPAVAATTAGKGKMPSLKRRFFFLLDIDGTLCHSDGIYFQVFKRLLAPYGYQVDEVFYKENVHGKVDADGARRALD